MGEITDILLGYANIDSGLDIPYEEVRELQLAAINERFQEEVDNIKLVSMRAADANISEIRSLEDIVPMLLPHTAYKSYPESYLSGGKWDKLTRWLNTVSARPTDGISLEGIEDIDDWVERLMEGGHYVSCSSGTTGKSAMLDASEKDMEFGKQNIVRAYCWGAGVEAAPEYHVFGLAPVAQVPKNTALGDALKKTFSAPGVEPFQYPVPPITVGSMTRMITLRKAMADGTALPGDFAEFEATSAARQKTVEEAVGLSADALIEARHEKIFLMGMWTSFHAIATEVRNRGYSAKDFHPGNLIYVGGGLKGAQLPPDYREFFYDTFNIKPERNFMMYSMQEINTSMPRCQEGGRYHIPPWLVCLPLNKEGDELLPIHAGQEVEGRAAFFDLSLDGRWGGIISGDKIEVDFSPCQCGARSPSIRDNVVRYSDLQEGDDKIGCAGTVDAYVRGLS
ncbi:hypothetical protein [Haliea sp. E17]|uniref:hypothetical protein n=1 Tax=Haliea sp. E17 TaxID=3401576 RepID=UPI003AB03760